jgi:glutaredoxin
MKKIIIYSKDNCLYCRKAKELLDRLNVQYEDRPIGVRYSGDSVREHCRSLDANAVVNTVPQIILINESGKEQYIGGYSELVYLQQML